MSVNEKSISLQVLRNNLASLTYLIMRSAWHAPSVHPRGRQNFPSAPAHGSLKKQPKMYLQQQNGCQTAGPSACFDIEESFMKWFLLIRILTSTVRKSLALLLVFCHSRCSMSDLSSNTLPLAGIYSDPKGLERKQCHRILHKIGSLRLRESNTQVRWAAALLRSNPNQTICPHCRAVSPRGGAGVGKKRVLFHSWYLKRSDSESGCQQMFKAAFLFS